MAESSSAVASTSTAATSSYDGLYDVFINHRGPDVKKTFGSHLYRRLLSYRLRVFLDQYELQRGDYFTTQIEDAIKSASVHVAIFSPGYADSVWCLNELVQMLDSKAPIIPVFYHVKPTELRWIRGKNKSYGEALEKLERKTEYDSQTRRYDSSTIQKWRNALSNVADISGFELEACNGDEGELLDKLVERVLKMVRKTALNVAKYPTGLDDKVKDFENSVLLQQQNRGKPQIFGIVGLGGVGKTTLVKELFNKKSSDYNRSCFLHDVRDKAGKCLLNLLQKELLKSLTGKDEPIIGVDEGMGILKKHISFPNILVILDDVDKDDQVYALLPDQTVLHSDSLILITSRDRHVLKTSGVEESSIYTLTGLNPHHSLQLFCLHSFNRPHPPLEFESLVKKFLEACGGLPLSLKVIGSLLKGRNISYWEDHLNKLANTLPSEIKQRLQISYDALDMGEQLIFLDIACFFIGEDMDMAVRIWDNGLCGFENIRDKCLVEVNSEKKIKMHDHLRDLGRELAKTSGLPRRFWRWTENDMDDLPDQSTVTAVRGIRMVPSEYNGIDYDDALGGIRMRRLQLLDTEDVLVERILTQVQYPNLKWLRWKNCPYSSLPSSISMKNLRVLQVGGWELKTLWEEELQAPLQLRELRIDAPLSNIPKYIGKLKHLERIVIGPAFKYEQNDNLTKLPEEFCLLESLKALVLKGCSKMKSLPECFGNLTNLQQIELYPCWALGRLPESFGNLTNLHHIQLSSCSSLERLPESFGNLTNLLSIQLSYCSALERLPESFGNLTNLHYIKLTHCFALERLPDSFCRLIKLQYLDLEDCVNLTMSSETLGDISTLEYIILTGCGKIEVLPRQVAHQRSLEQLCLRGTNLKLKELPAIGDLSDLEVLVLGGPLLDTLPSSLCDLKKLKELELYKCKKLKCLPASLGDLKNLKKLCIQDCKALKSLPSSLGDLKNLKELKICGCKKLKCLPASLGLLTQLTELKVEDCPLIHELPLKEVVKGQRETVSDLDPSIHNCILPRLQRLELERTGISEISFAEGVCSNLRILRVFRCHNVVEVGTLPKTLIHLKFEFCDNLRKINKFDGLAKLQVLDIKSCIKLEELRGIETLVSLTWFWAIRCVKLKSLQGLGQLTKLEELWVRGCSELEEVESIQDCMSILSLDVADCPKLQWGAGVLEQLRQRCHCCTN